MTAFKFENPGKWPFPPALLHFLKVYLMIFTCAIRELYQCQQSFTFSQIQSGGGGLSFNGLVSLSSASMTSTEILKLKTSQNGMGSPVWPLEPLLGKYLE